MSSPDDAKNHPDYPLNLRYEERQLIVILDDETDQSGSSSPQRANPEKPGLDWARVAMNAMPLLPIANPILGLAGGVLIQTINSNQEGIQVLGVPGNKASRLKLPLGHPRNRVIYAGNPADPPVYYPLAQFHHFTFEHKFAEVIHLLLALGATTLEVEYETGWSRDFAVKISVPLPDSPIDVKLENEYREGTKSALIFKAELEGEVTPWLPDNLVWYPHEPTWQQIAEARLNYGLKEFSLKINYEDDFKINADLQVMAKKAGLDCGGKFQTHQATIWRIQGKFRTSGAAGEGKKRKKSSSL